MRKKYRIKFILLVISLLIVAACSKYEKILRSQDMELKYRKALEYYNKKDYSRAATVYEQIVNVFKASARGDSVYYYYAYSYYYQDDYIMAGHIFKELASAYTRSGFAEEAEYMSGYCFYKQSPRPSLDQENTRMAIQAFQYFMYKFPESRYVPECKRLIEEMNNKLVDKAYKNARLYYDLGYYKSSIISLKNCLNKYPDTKYREELMYMMYESSFKLADNSVESKKRDRFQNALDEYYSFVGEFPKSKYIKEVEKMFAKTKAFLGEQ
jgi:outer membrane protein assembly factor BamD